jgi:hypothetical protein
MALVTTISSQEQCQAICGLPKADTFVVRSCWQVKNPTTGAVYILLEARLSELPGAVPKASKKKNKNKDAPEQLPFEVHSCWVLM